MDFCPVQEDSDSSEGEDEDEEAGSDGEDHVDLSSPAGEGFCGTRCCCRVLRICLYFGLLIVAGTLLVIPHELLGGLVLATGPTVIILGFFYRRYALSSTKRQLCTTFCASIAWMLPLLVAITTLDPQLARWFGKVSFFECSWPASEEVGMATVYNLAYCANCSSGNVLAGWTVGPYGTVGFSGLLEMSDTLASEGDLACEALSRASVDTLDPMCRIERLRHGKRSVWPQSTANLSSSFDTLFGRGACPCGMSYWADHIARHDSCRVSGSASALEDEINGNSSCPFAPPASCNMLAPDDDNHDCADQEEVSITFRFRSRTVAWAASFAFFRAAFLEESSSRTEPSMREVWLSTGWLLEQALQRPRTYSTC
eukprot:TRINITY_DN22048_c0_g4_i1.p1 TRINITY_DN22048_c0_g4~~TRINITY_DN22048_c0_g4_i1.p1  ORF type:complete len:370 (-),score=49.63 TRINITY_DN22048_c0_g4_i1:826-1935(-)